MLNEGSDLPDAGVSILCNKESRVFNKRSLSAKWTRSANTDQYAHTLKVAGCRKSDRCTISDKESKCIEFHHLLH